MPGHRSTPSWVLMQSASAMTRRSRRRDPRSWIFLWSVLSSLTLLGLAAFAYNRSWQATMLTAADEYDGFEMQLPTLEHTPLNRPPPSAYDRTGYYAVDHVPPPPREWPLVHLVIASYKNQNMSWIPELPILTKHWNDSWEVFRYISDAQEDELGDPNGLMNEFTVAQPDGREALGYLTYIVNNYRRLPDIIIFVHGHRFAWHQPESMVDKLAALNLSAIADEGYVNLRCQLVHGCREDDMYYFDEDGNAIQKGGNTKGFFQLEPRKFWKEFMEEEFGPMPTQIGRRCCSQFAVTRDVILARPLSFWRRLRSPLARKKKWHGEHHHHLGMYFETIWHIVMGKPAVHCPGKEHCQKVYFSDKIHCEGDDEYFRPGMGTKGTGWSTVTCYNDMRNDTKSLLSRGPQGACP